MATAAASIKCFIDQMFGENAYVVSCAPAADSRVGWVIDPGLGRQVSDLLAYLATEQISVEAILLTHGHADHIAGLDTVKQAHPQAQVWIAAGDAPMLSDAQLNLSAPFGFNVVMHTSPTGDLAPGGNLSLGPLTWQILDTSGHSPGGRSLYCPQAGIVFTGDALFKNSIGRTDFPGADHDQLIRNIQQHLLTLPAETVVYSGHGPTTTIGNERKSNPFLADP